MAIQHDHGSGAIGATDLGRRRWDLGVVVRARDEEDRIEACVRSILVAIKRARHRVRRSHVVVVDDTCVDRTGARATTLLGSLDATVLVVEFASAGAARRVGTERAISALSPTDPRISEMSHR